MRISNCYPQMIFEIISNRSAHNELKRGKWCNFKCVFRWLHEKAKINIFWLEIFSKNIDFNLWGKQYIVPRKRDQNCENHTVCRLELLLHIIYSQKSFRNKHIFPFVFHCETFQQIHLWEMSYILFVYYSLLDRLDKEQWT